MNNLDRRNGVTDGLAIKAPCVAATTATITLFGLQTVDGVVLTEGDRVLVKNQADTTANGVYVVHDSLAWSRDLDFDGYRDAVNGTFIPVAVGGTVNGGSLWQLSATNPVSFGTTALSFVSAITATSMSFIQAGTGAVARTVQNKERDIVSVLDFAADSTGVADSAAAFTSAGSIATTLSVLIPRGIWKLNTSPNPTGSVTWYVSSGAIFTGSGVLPGKVVGIGNAYTSGTWLFSQGAGASKMGWIEQNAIISGVGTKIGVTGASHSVAGSTNDTSIGVVGFGVTRDSTSNKTWGGYIEAVRSAGAGQAFGLEINSTNLDTTIATEATPYSDFAALGNTGGLWIAAGGDATINPITYDSNFAIGVGYNGAKHHRGLVFQDTGLTRDGGATGRAHAIAMAYDQAIEWYEFTTHTIALSIVSNITNAANAQTVLFNNTGLSISSAKVGLSGDIQISGSTFETSKTVTATNGLTTYTASTKYNYLTGTAGASLAITLPSAAAGIDGEIIVIMSTANRAATTWTSTGATFVGAPAALTANVPVKLQYDHGTTAWYITA